MASAVPSPAENPELWDTLGIGTRRWPSVYPGVGSVKVSVKTAAKVDQQTANGKDRARAKLKGRAVTPVSVHFQFTREIWAETIELRSEIDPGGDGYDKVWEISYPEATLRKFNRILFHDMSELIITGDAYSFSVEGDAWDEPAKVLTGGTKTPTTPVKWDPKHVYQTTSTGNVVDFGEGPVTATTSDGNTYGFGGPSAPTPEIP